MMLCDVHVLLLPQPRGFSSDLDISRAHSTLPPWSPVAQELGLRHPLSCCRVPEGVPHLPLLRTVPPERRQEAPKDVGASAVANGMLQDTGMLHPSCQQRLGFLVRTLGSGGSRGGRTVVLPSASSEKLWESRPA